MTKSDLTEIFALRPVPRSKSGLGGRRVPKERASRDLYFPPDGMSCVYAIMCGDTGFVKFGRSAQPHRRINEMQTSSPVELMFLCLLEVAKRSAVRFEREIHKALDREGCRVRGEWFEIGRDKACDLMLLVADAAGIKVATQRGGQDTTPEYQVDLEPEYERSIIARNGGGS